MILGTDGTIGCPKSSFKDDITWAKLINDAISIKNNITMYSSYKDKFVNILRQLLIKNLWRVYQEHRQQIQKFCEAKKMFRKI